MSVIRWGFKTGQFHNLVVRSILKDMFFLRYGNE